MARVIYAAFVAVCVATALSAEDKIQLARGESVKTAGRQAQAANAFAITIEDRLWTTVGAESASQMFVTACQKGEASLEVFIVGKTGFNARAQLTQHVREYLHRSDLQDFTLYFYASQEQEVV